MGNYSKKNIVICIYQRDARSTEKSHINQTLEQLQLDLLNEEDVQVAFVFSNSSLVDAIDFVELEQNHIYYLGSGALDGVAPLSHIWLLGTALLKKKILEDKENLINAEYRLYCITDNNFSKIECEKILAVLDKENLPIMPILIRDDYDNSSLETYVQKNGQVKLHEEWINERMRSEN